jgi:hypothetical protein
MKSWIHSANEPGSQFPIQNLPYGVFRDLAAMPHCCVAIGEEILDLTLRKQGLSKPAASSRSSIRVRSIPLWHLGPLVGASFVRALRHF